MFFVIPFDEFERARAPGLVCYNTGAIALASVCLFSNICRLQVIRRGTNARAWGIAGSVIAILGGTAFQWASTVLDHSTRTLGSPVTGIEPIRPSVIETQSRNVCQTRTEQLAGIFLMAHGVPDLRDADPALIYAGWSRSVLRGRKERTIVGLAFSKIIFLVVFR